MEKLLSRLEAQEAWLTETREHLHQYPELSGEEKETLAFVRQQLADLQIPFVEVEKGGILGYLTGGYSAKTVLLRADLDALPVEEAPDNGLRPKKVVSRQKGIAHVCGHDAHTAMLLAAARLLAERRSELNGTAIFCFERAEEGGGPGHAFGVRPLLAYLEQRGIKPDSCLAIHVSPELDTGKISVEPGGVMAGNFGFEIHIKGTGGHGSRPDLANNPLDCFVAFYQSLAGIRLREVSPYNLLTFSIPHVRVGTLGNVIEEDLYFEGTVRSLDKESLERFRDAFLRQLDHITAAFGCSCRIDLMYLEAPLCNDRKVAETAGKVVRDLFGEKQYEACKANLGSESFAHYTECFPGAMAFLGIKNEQLGSGASLHSDKFDLDEAALKYGAGLLAGYAFKELAEEKGKENEKESFCTDPVPGSGWGDRPGAFGRMRHKERR